jgi:hypothetical protein
MENTSKVRKHGTELGSELPIQIVNQLEAQSLGGARQREVGIYGLKNTASLQDNLVDKC